MNKITEKLKEHRTIRRFQEKVIDEKIMQEIITVGKQAATANGMQTYSIIIVKDQAKKNKIAEICQQSYIAEIPYLFIFIVDWFRNIKIAEAQGLELEEFTDFNSFFLSIVDTSIAAQNMAVAAESFDLGTVFLGSVQNDREAIIEILNLPKFTLPIFGFGLGYPAQEAQLKPRMDAKLNVFEDEYKIFDDYLKENVDYDKKMGEYYDTRQLNKRMDSFTLQILNYFKRIEGRENKNMELFKKQGFIFKNGK